MVLNTFHDYSSCVGEDWFRCNNGHCISRHWLCDKEDDCMDWSDEADCKDDEVAALEPATMAATCAGTDYKYGFCHYSVSLHKLSGAEMVSAFQ